MKKLAVVAFGGNALLRGDQKGTIDEQEKNVSDTCMSLLELIKNDYNIVITMAMAHKLAISYFRILQALKCMACPKCLWIYAVRFRRDS